MFEKLKKSAEVKIKEIVGNLKGTGTLLLDKKDTGSKCYWEGFIEGLDAAEALVLFALSKRNLPGEKEEEIAKLKETIKCLREEGDEYQKKLDKIDELALLIENANKRIREKI